MCRNFLASKIVIGSNDCPYHELANVMVNTPGTPFREEWKNFSRLIGLPSDFISRWEKSVHDKRIIDVVIDILQNWSNQKVVTLGQLTEVLRDVPLVSTADAIEKHFNSVIVSKTVKDTSTELRSRKSSLVNNHQITHIELLSSSMASKPLEVNPPELRSRKSSLVQNQEPIQTESPSALTPFLKTENEDINFSVDHLNQHLSKDDNIINAKRVKKKLTQFLRRKVCLISLMGFILGGLCLAPVFIFPDALKCKMSTCPKGKEEYLSCRDITLNISVRTQKEYEQAVSKFDNIGCISISIVSLNPSDWSEKSQLSHSKYIRILTISNVTSIDTLLIIMSMTPDIRKLELSSAYSSSCTFTESRLLGKNKIAFLHLSTIIVSNFGSCSPLYFSFSTTFSLPQLKNFTFERSIIDDNNINFVLSFMHNSANSLRAIKLTGEMRSNKYFFSISKPLIQVRTIQLDIKRRKVLLVPFDSHEIAGENFCRALVNIHTFENTVGIDFLDFINVLKCTQLQFITARVIFHAKNPFLNINAAFKGKELENVTLSFQFDTPCPSCQDISLLGIEDFKTRIKKKHTIAFRICPCNDDKDEMGSKERDTFMLEHNQNKNMV